LTGIRPTHLIYEAMADGLDAQTAAQRVRSQFDLTEEKADLLALLSELHIGEWEKFYDNSRYGIMIVEGVVWTLTIEYKDKKRRFTSGGANACPYNFRDLENLLGVDAYYAEDEGEDLSEED